MEKKFDLILSELQKLNERVSNIESGQKELNQMFKVIHDRQEETDARIEAMTMDLNKLHGLVVKIDKKVDAILEDQKSIHEILGDHEVAIRTLRRTV